MKNVPIKELRRLLAYDPETGLITHRYRHEGPRKWNTRYAGTTAGAVGSNGYLQLTLRGLTGGKLLSHRVAWALHYGAWPDLEIDHINGVKADNRAANLRLATRSQNAAYQRNNPRNRSGFRGVTFQYGKWQAEIMVQRTKYSLGAYDTKEAAAAAYREAALRMRGRDRIWPTQDGSIGELNGHR